MFILKKGHQPGVYLPLWALFLVFSKFNDNVHSNILGVRKLRTCTVVCCPERFMNKFTNLFMNDP